MSKVVPPTVGQMLAMSNEELRCVDPVVMNLVVAKGLSTLADLDIDHYVRIVDEWGRDLAMRLPMLEREYHNSPQNWDNDIVMFKLGLVCWYVDVVQGMAYREDHIEAQQRTGRMVYTDPNDLFLNGLLDTGRGTCANLALLHVVIGQRIGLPVSLACVGSHFICRYDDGVTTRNIEATETGRGGFSCQTGEYLLKKYKLPLIAQASGSDLCAVTPREMLGLFVGLRARNLENTNRMTEAERDYLLARYLFPNNRSLYIAQNQTSVQCSMDLFDPGEKGHPTELHRWLQEVVTVAPWKRKPLLQSQYKEPLNGSDVDDFFSQISVGM